METEVINIGSIFAGMGILILCGVLAYLVYQIARWYKSGADLEERMTTFEECVLNNIAKKKGIDLDKEVEKRSVFKERKFRKRIREEMVIEMFGKGDSK